MYVNVDFTEKQLVDWCFNNLGDLSQDGWIVLVLESQ